MTTRGLTLAFASLCFASLACGDGERVVPLLWPTRPDMQSAILFVGPVDRPPTRSLVLEAAGPTRVDVEADAEVRAVFYPKTLDALGFTEGEHDWETEPATCEQLAPAEVLGMRVVGAELAEWILLDGPSDELRTFMASDWTDRCASCRGFEQIDLEVEVGGPAGTLVLGAVPLPDGRGLVTLQSETDHGLFLVDLDHAQRIEGCEAYHQVLAWAGDGRLVAGTYNGLEFLELDLETNSCTVTESLSFPGVNQNPRWMAGSGPGEALELFVLTGLGELFVLDESGLSRIGQVPYDPSDPIYQEGGLVRLGPGRAVAAFEKDTLLHYDGGSVRFEQVPDLPMGGRIQELSVTSDGRLLVGADGQIRIQTESSWRILETSPAFDTRRIHIFRDGWLAILSPPSASAFGALTDGVCPSDSARITGSPNPELRHGFALEDRVLVADGIDWREGTDRAGARRLVWLIPK